MLLTFTHAQSGTIIKDSGELSEDVAGPKLQFAKSEFVPVAELANMLADLPVTEVAVFSRNPVVFLNGCETGTSGFYATTNQDFAGTFLRLGSRGVIVTEAPIWTFFGYNFGVSLIRQLAGGDAVTVALWRARNDYLTKAHNPLGLLYSYYGGADVAVTFH